MRSRRLSRVSPILPALVIALLALGCSWVIADTPMSTVHPTTEAGRLIQALYGRLTFWVLAIFVVVEGFLIYAMLRFRRRPGDAALPEQTHGNTPLEVLWTLFPVIPIVLVMVPSLQVTCALQQPARDDALRVDVTGKQWWWDVEYPEYGVVTANEIHVPVGRMVSFQLQSDNVIHSFWVPRLMGKRDLVPGRSQSMWFTPERTGVYQGQCAELCGASHARMKFRVFVDTPEDFAAWVERQKRPAATSLADPGFTAFLQGGCIACHAIDFPGSPARQRLGPTLTHLASRTTLAAGVLPNDAESLAHWIREPEAFKPGVLMPNLNLGDEQVSKLVAFLQTLE